MRSLPIALTLVLLSAMPTVAQSPVPTTTLYACVTYNPPDYEDPYDAIFSGEFEVVRTTDCASPPTPSTDPVVIEGSGSRNSKPFVLADGDYEFVLSVRGPRDACSYGWFYLTDVESGDDVSDSLEESNYLYGVPEGRYYLQPDNYERACKWTVRIRPFTY